jgi:hypothetical protein
MKRVIVILILLALCLSLLLPAFAAEDTFVPSIGYKDGPGLEDAKMDSEDVNSCLVITSLKAAQEKTTDISQKGRDLLLEIYQKLDSGEMKLPVGEGFVIRELVDISWKQEACVDAEHPHQQELNKEGVTVTLELEMGITEKNELFVFAYHNGQWDPVKEVKINGDGTVTCVFEHFCPVAFAFRQEAGGSQTGDAAREDLMGYVMLMTLSAAAILLLVLRRRKHTR